MARPPRLLASGVLYHVIVRGNHKQETFYTPQDYETYMERLARYRSKYRLSIYAFCLMPNHVHLLLECSEEPLSKFMQGVQQSYTQYFNRAHKTVGHLFQGRYKAIICEKEEYLLTLVRYIHLNPVRSKLVERPEQYNYSGHRMCLTGESSNVLDSTYVLNLLGGRGAYETFVLDGLEEGHKESYYELHDQRFLGADEFARGLKEKSEGKMKSVKKKTLGKVMVEAARRLRITPEALRGPDRNWKVSRVRTVLAFLLIRRLGFSVNEVANYLRRDPTTMSSLVSRLSVQMQRDLALQEEVERLSRIV